MAQLEGTRKPSLTAREWAGFDLERIAASIREVAGRARSVGEVPAEHRTLSEADRAELESLARTIARVSRRYLGGDA